ncbi:MAG TPA: hypothetical protein VD816_11910, partial [Ohtaekwangia sp.]|nr:hypothetical protein [Ohtaekwangia sp.]
IMKDNGQAEDIRYFSMLSPYNGQTGTRTFPYVTSFWWADDEETKARQGKIEITGSSLRFLYYMAYSDTLWNEAHSMIPGTGIYQDTIKHPHQKRSYGQYWYRPILEVRDSTMFETDKSVQHRFNYTLKVPTEKATAMVLQGIMQKDLARCFD